MAAERVLVIVESPAKAKTIEGYLNGRGGRDFRVKASVGHVRDLSTLRPIDVLVGVIIADVDAYCSRSVSQSSNIDI